MKRYEISSKKIVKQYILNKFDKTNKKLLRLNKSITQIKVAFIDDSFKKNIDDSIRQFRVFVQELNEEGRTILDAIDGMVPEERGDCSNRFRPLRMTYYALKRNLEEKIKNYYANHYLEIDQRKENQWFNEKEEEIDDIVYHRGFDRL